MKLCDFLNELPLEGCVVVQHWGEIDHPTVIGHGGITNFERSEEFSEYENHEITSIFPMLYTDVYAICVEVDF